MAIIKVKRPHQDFSENYLIPHCVLVDTRRKNCLFNFMQTPGIKIMFITVNLELLCRWLLKHSNFTTKLRFFVCVLISSKGHCLVSKLLLRKKHLSHNN